MALEDFLSDLSGGFQGAGMGAQILGGMNLAKVGFASNPWVAGGLLLGGAGLGLLDSLDPAKKRAARLNERLGGQEAAMNDLNIQSMKTNMALERKKRASMDQFGNVFSGYLSAMAKSRSAPGPALAAGDLGV